MNLLSLRDTNRAINKPKKMNEHDEQCAVFKWALGSKYRPGAVLKYPELNVMFAIPNAAKRSLKMGAFMKAEGLRAGVPDICLPIARRGYNALFVEMKTTKGRLTDSQKWWAEELKAHGCMVITAHGATNAIDAITAYLEHRIVGVKWTC